MLDPVILDTLPSQARDVLLFAEKKELLPKSTHQQQEATRQKNNFEASQ